MKGSSLFAKQLSRMDQTHEYVEISVVLSDRMFRISKQFDACRMKWSIDLFGTEDETIGFSLTNLSDRSLRTDYKIIIKNQSSTGDDHVWRDPDGVIIFSPAGTMDCTWGCEDIISFRRLHTVTGLCVKGIVNFRIDITIFSTIDEMNEMRKNDLTLPEDERISRSAFGFEGYHKMEQRMQDNLITNRLIVKSMHNAPSSFEPESSP